MCLPEIRYTALSLPRYIDNGVFGDLLPLVGLLVVAQKGDIYAGRYNPVAGASVTFVVSLLRETKNVFIWREVEAAERVSRA